MNNKLVIISGPTATGKTGLGIELSQLVNIHSELEPVVMNFDSLCFFKEVSIGTAKPTKEERQNIQHELFDVYSIAEDFNASKYVNLAEKKIKSLLKENKIIFLVGGSAFYLRALIKGMYESKEIDLDLKHETERKYEEEGIQFILDYLCKNDPKILNLLHNNDHYRLMRAYYHHKITLTLLSDEKSRMDKIDPYDLKNNVKNNWELHHIYLDIPKKEHYTIIRNRTHKMINEGLITEVDNLLKQGFTGLEKPLQSIGYKETVEFLSGNISAVETEDELIDRIFISTRQFAKSQRTFFKKIRPKLEYHPLNDREKIKNDFLTFLK
ncbi:MAG: tRNA (adenosine(37)-N6)-dimethylallyltransferase MiaA [Bacteriovoracaceae bacterium]|jgi:tRNA dimethylallyltransferase|nr:tRNA (adenosine(37)-N6)-dimethylallyltransferase MiaA [Bacteriovoracaceae bacterium]